MKKSMINQIPAMENWPRISPKKMIESGEKARGRRILSPIT